MNAELVDSIGGLRERLVDVRRSGANIGLVPTMGALHAGRYPVPVAPAADAPTAS